MLIFSIQGKISVDDDKTNISHSFYVPESISTLKIRYSYFPKTLQDSDASQEIIRACFERYDEKLIGEVTDYLPVKNLVTLSLDDNGAYRGAAHRQANEQVHIISEDYASFGFIKGQIHSGEWCIVLNVHSVSCNVSYSITVEGE